MKRKVIAVTILSLLVTVASLLLYLKLYSSPRVDGVSVEFVSQHPDYSISNDLDQQKLNELFSDAGITPFRQQPFLGQRQPDNNPDLTLKNLTKIKVIFYDLAQHDPNKYPDVVVNSSPEGVLYRTGVGTLVNSTKLEIPIFIVSGIGQKYNLENDEQILRMLAVRAIYYNLQQPPIDQEKITQLSGTYAELMQKYEDLFIVVNKTSSLNIFAKLKDFSLISEVHAQLCGGNIQCGDNYEAGTCINPGGSNDRGICDITIPSTCLGGTCTPARQCIPNGTGGQCVIYFGFCVPPCGAGPADPAYCVVSGSCAPPSTPAPTPGPSSSPGPTPSPGWGACGSCSTCGFNPGECQTDPSGNCVWNPAVCAGGGASCAWVPLPAGCKGEGENIPAPPGTCKEPAGQGCSLPSHCGVAPGDWWPVCNIPDQNKCCSGLVANAVNTCLCPADPTCTISLNPKPLNISAGEMATLGSTVTQNDGTISSVTFSSSNISLVSATSPDNTNPFTSTVTGISEGNVTIFAAATMNGGVRCTDSVGVTVVPSWWQAVGGDAVAVENIYSKLPLAQNLIKDNTIGSPGLAIYASNLQIGSGSISSSNQNAQANTNFDSYSFSYFQSLLAPDSIAAAGANNISDITDPTAQTADGYVWINHMGNWTTTADIVIPSGRKVVVFVNGTANINNNITITNSSNSYFMLIVSNGININPTVTTMQGVFYTDGNFNLPSSGLASSPFVLTGSAFALQFNFARFLSPLLRDTTPAESFVFNPALIANYPADISPKKVVWQEVLP